MELADQMCRYFGSVRSRALAYKWNQVISR